MATNNNINYGPAALPGTVPTPVLGNNIDRAPAPVDPGVGTGYVPTVTRPVVPVTEQPVINPPIVVARTAVVIPVAEQPVSEVVAESTTEPNIPASNQQRYLTILANGSVVTDNASTLDFEGNGFTITSSGPYGAVITLTGTAGYGNSNVATFLANYGSNTISTVGNITGNFVAPGGNGQVMYNRNGVIGVSPNDFNFDQSTETLYVTTGSFSGTANTGIGAVYGGVPGYTVLGSAVMAQFTGNTNTYSQVNFQNINNGTRSSGDYIITADNGTDSTYYLDLGLASSNHADPAFFGDTSTANDGYLYVNGASQAGPGGGVGNLIIGSTNGVIKMFVGNTAQANVKVTVDSAGLSVTGNVRGGNVLVSGIASATGNITGGNVLTAGIVSATGNITGGNINSPTLNNSGNISVVASGNTWTFDSTGTLTVPATNSVPGQISTQTTLASEKGFDLRITAGNTDGCTVPGGDMYLSAGVGYNGISHGAGNVNIVTGDRYGNVTGNIWRFDSSGALTLPLGSATIKNTAGNAVAFGLNAGLTSQGANAVAIGINSGVYSQSTNAVAVGTLAGNGGRVTTNYVSGAVSPSTTLVVTSTTGIVPGMVITGTGFFGTITVVTVTNSTTLEISASAVFTPSGALNFTGSQGDNSVAIGTQAGQIQQGQFAVAIGDNAGNSGQGTDAVAIGASAGLRTQGAGAVAFGQGTGEISQGANAVAIGKGAGQVSQGINSVAIGQSAGLTNQGNNSIILNATGAALDQTTANTFTVAPVRNDVANIGEVVFYNTTSKEITYGNVISVAGNITGGNVLTGGLISATGNVTGNYILGNGSQLTSINAVTVDITDTNGLTTVYYPTFVENRANAQIARADVDLTYRTDDNLLTVGNVSVTGNITGAYLFGNGSQLTGITASVPGQTILPTIQTITAAARPAGLFGGGQGGANVTVANVIPVTEYGVIITDGTSNEKYATGSLGSIPGTVSLNFDTGLNSTQYTLFAYVTSNAGTYYSNAVTGTSGICLLAGTKIALSDGTHKAIEHITYTDKLLSWDFDRGCYAETTAMWIKRGETGSQYNLLTFSDGTTLRTFDQHRIFNKQAGAFTYPMTDATPVGTVTVNEHGQEITLTNKQVIQDAIEYYNVITDHHMNLFSDSVLTSCRFNNIYPITDMKFVKDGRTLRTRAEFENIPDRFFYGLRLAEQTTDVNTVEWYVNRLLSTEVSTESELAV